MNKKFKWLYPGIRIKRWISLSALGVALLIIGVVKLVYDSMPVVRKLDMLVIFLGAALIIAGIRSMVKSILSIFSSLPGKDLVDVIYKKRYLERGPKIVTIGGGHGLAALLMGLKEHTTNLIAVVTVADSGGSSGRLRQEFDMLPPGDIRNCLVSLADAPSLMGELFQFRFKEDSELKGHNFGNLFITAMTQLTGDFKRAVEESSRVLAIRGKVLPSTLHKVSLIAEYKDGSFIEGEATIPEKKLPISRVYLKSIEPGSGEIKPTLEAIEAIREAQIIVIGPGSLYTSILPNLVIKDITRAIVESSALKIYVCNVMTQHGETDNYTASEHLKTLLKHTHPKIVDYCVINNKMPDKNILVKYQQEKSFPAKADVSEIKKMGYRVIQGDLVHTTDFVRHDSGKLAKSIIEAFRKEAIQRAI
ncbi:MAG: YvcK family protein [Candidatus Omnitrophica bacterium]|nr:YvcK family protein [Candidatus Omnitrophota bacterium]